MTLIEVGSDKDWTDKFSQPVDAIVVVKKAPKPKNDKAPKPSKKRDVRRG